LPKIAELVTKEAQEQAAAEAAAAAEASAEAAPEGLLKAKHRQKA